MTNALTHAFTDAQLLVNNIWLAPTDPVDDPEGVQIHVDIRPLETGGSGGPGGGAGGGSGTGGGLAGTGGDIPELLLWGGIGLVALGAAFVIIRLIRQRRRSAAAGPTS